MKLFCTIVLLIMFSFCKAATYYFSTAFGDDSRTSAQAQNPATPWKTIAKFNSLALSANDQVLFDRGEEYFGTITLTRSGSATQPIFIGAYGTGAKPIITGFQTVSGWAADPNGIYEAVINGQSTLSMVLFNGSFQVISRWPKTDYLISQSHSGNASLTSNAISSAPSFVGGEVVYRATHWDLMRANITAQTSTTISFTNLVPPIGTTYPPKDGYGFFFQNHVNACTLPGEWCYESATHKLKMYFGAGGPGSAQVKASILEYLVVANSVQYVTFDNLVFTGSNSRSFNSTGASNLKLQNCDFIYSGKDAIWLNKSPISIINCTIDHSNNNAITANSTANLVVQGNQISNSGNIAGMGLSGDGQAEGMAYMGNSCQIQNNIVKNTGYVPIYFVGTNSLVQNNYIDSFCLTQDDGGGVYSWSTTQGGSRVLNNVILNGIGAPAGTGDNQKSAQGIYMDQGATGVEIGGNTVANCAYAGLYVHIANNLNIHDNIFYNNGFNTSTTGQVNYSAGSATLSAISFNNNIVFARTVYQNAVIVDPANSSSLDFFTSADNNYYCRPLNEANNFSVHLTSGFKSLDLAGWKSLLGKEGNSKASPIGLTDVNNIRFEYNETGASKLITLGANYVDAKGATYNGSISLAPYSSAVLLQTGTSGIPVPLRINDLSAQVNATNFTLSWKVDGDSIESIDLQKSYDGTQFNFLETIPAVSSKTYTREAVTTYYRTRVVFNGQIAYSNIVVISPLKPQVTISQNHNQVTVTSQVSGTFLLSDVSGRPLRKGSIRVGQTQINLWSLASGVYVLKITTSTEVYTFKILKS